MTSKTHASSTNLASAVGAAHEVVNDNGGILVIGTQLFFDLVKVSLIYENHHDLMSVRCLDNAQTRSNNDVHNDNFLSTCSRNIVSKRASQGLELVEGFVAGNDVSLAGDLSKIQSRTTIAW